MARYRRFDTARVGISMLDASSDSGSTMTSGSVPEVIEGARSRRAGLRSAMSALE
jgi:hypothetical protein